MRPCPSWNRLIFAGLRSIHPHSMAELNKCDSTASSRLMVPGVAVRLCSGCLSIAFPLGLRITASCWRWRLYPNSLAHSRRGAANQQQAVRPGRRMSGLLGCDRSWLAVGDPSSPPTRRPPQGSARKNGVSGGLESTTILGKTFQINAVNREVGNQTEQPCAISCNN